MDNDQRSNLTLAEFIEKYHYTSNGNYQAITDAALKHRFTQHFGEQISAENADLIDWQLGESRTHPRQHQDVFDGAENDDNYLKQVQSRKGQEDGEGEHYNIQSIKEMNQLEMDT